MFVAFACKSASSVFNSAVLILASSNASLSNNPPPTNAVIANTTGLRFNAVNAVDKPVTLAVAPKNALAIVLPILVILPHTPIANEAIACDLIITNKPTISFNTGIRPPQASMNLSTLVAPSMNELIVSDVNVSKNKPSNVAFNESILA